MEFRNQRSKPADMSYCTENMFLQSIEQTICILSEEFMEAYSSQAARQVYPARRQRTSHTALSIQAICNNKNILTSNISVVKI